MEYGQCKAYLESQPLMEGIELLAPNVQMVIRQFHAMVSLVISSCLGTVTMTAQDRAQVVEFWIRVAKVCHGTAPGVPPVPNLRMVVCGLPCMVPEPLVPGA